MPARGATSVRVLDTLEAFDAIAPEWDDLVARAGLGHPFVTHTWLRAWWTCLAPEGARLHVITIRNGGHLVAGAALMRERRALYGVPVERLVSMQNDHSPRWDVLVDPADADAAPTLWDAMRPEGSRLLLELREVPADAAVVAAWRARAAASRLRLGTWNSNASPYVPLEGAWDAYHRSISPNMRHNLRRRARALGQVGQVSPETIADGDLEGRLAVGCRIEAAGWKGPRGASTAIACHPSLVRFYTELARAASARGWLRLLFLRAGDRRVSFGYGLEYANRLFLLKNGYEPEFATSSPTQVHMLEVLRDAYGRGLDEVDFLGDADAWKLDWTDTVRQQVWVHVFPESLAGRALYAAKYRLLPALRQHEGFERVRRAFVGATGRAAAKEAR